MRSLTAALLFVFLALPLAAQEPLAETIEVHVVNIDVVVTDRTGHPVTGLTKDDFEVLENGKPQPISNFYEVRGNEGSLPALKVEAVPATPAPSAPPPKQAAAAPDDIRARRFVVCLDNYSLEPMQRNTVLTALRKFVDANMRPGDEMSLLLWARKLEMVTPLTNDKAEVMRGLDSILSRSRAGLSAAQDDERARQECRTAISEVDEFDPPVPNQRVSYTWENAWVACEGAIQAFADSQWQNSKSLLADVKSMVSTLAGVDGRKVLVLAGAALPEHPGRDASLWMQQEFVPHQKFLARAKVNPNKGFGESGSRSQTLSIVDTARFANANGVTFYMINAADSRDASSAASPLMVDHTEQFMQFTDTAAAYLALAAITGGSSLSNTQNFGAAFQTLERDLSSFYSIGYKPAEGSSAERTITVRSKKAGLNVRARQSYTPKTQDQEMNDRLISNLFHHGAKGDWPITLTAQTPQKEGDVFKLPVTIEMPPNLTLLPDGDKMTGGFVLYIVVGTKEGAKSKVTRTARKIEMPPAAEAGFRSKPMSYTLMLSVRPGDNIVSVGVVDQVSNSAGFERLDVTAK